MREETTDKQSDTYITTKCFSAISHKIVNILILIQNQLVYERKTCNCKLKIQGKFYSVIVLSLHFGCTCMDSYGNCEMHHINSSSTKICTLWHILAGKKLQVRLRLGA